MKSKILKELIKKNVYQIRLTARDESDEVYKSDVMFTTSEKGVDFLFTLFQLLKTETRSFLPVSDFNKNDEFETTFAILYQEFISSPHLKESGSVREAIVEYIDELRRKPQEIIKYIHKEINSLRQERIDFWELVKEKIP